MSDIIHPGPVSIPPGSEPGGVVIHVYGVPSGTFLQESKAATQAIASYNAGRDANIAIARLPKDDHAFCLVAYDGDSGERFTAGDWGG